MIVRVHSLVLFTTSNVVEGVLLPAAVPVAQLSVWDAPETSDELCEISFDMQRDLKEWARFPGRPTGFRFGPVLVTGASQCVDDAPGTERTNAQ